VEARHLLLIERHGGERKASFDEFFMKGRSASRIGKVELLYNALWRVDLKSVG
jgi:hypothetical protein